MTNDRETPEPQPAVLSGTIDDTPRKFDAPSDNRGGDVHVSVTAETLNIHESSFSALEELAAKNPEIALAVIDATNHVVNHDTRRYITGAACATVVCSAMLICATYIAVNTGLGAGIGFFLVCATVAAIFGAFFTGRMESLSWTVDLIRGRLKPGKPDSGTAVDVPSEP